MIEFFPPILEHFCEILSIFRTNCSDGSHFAQMGSVFAQNTTPNPCSLLSRHTPLSGISTYTKHPQLRPKTTPNKPFSWSELKSGRNEVLSGQFGPHCHPKWAKCLNSEVGKTFLELGKKNYS